MLECDWLHVCIYDGDVNTEEESVNTPSRQAARTLFRAYRDIGIDIK
jgi:hypothetical protein